MDGYSVEMIMIPRNQSGCVVLYYLINANYLSNNIYIYTLYNKLFLICLFIFVPACQKKYNQNMYTGITTTAITHHLLLIMTRHCLA